MGIGTIIGIIFILLGGYLVWSAMMRGLDRERSAVDWLLFPELTLVETVIKELFGEAGLRIALGGVGAVLFVIGLLLL
ncbi:MAG: hypothetical protein L0154_17825 [Chloroflexi bacterium]|nr:hypothetical protein [Chloroflexota bacterium]